MRKSTWSHKVHSLLSGILLTAAVVTVASPSTLAATLTPRVAPSKTAVQFPVASTVVYDRIVVKFREGSSVTLLTQGLTAPATAPDANNLNRDLSDIQERSKIEGLELKKLFTKLDANQLSSVKQQAETASGKQMADMNLYFQMPVPAGFNSAKLADLVAYLNSKASVEIAYANPKPQPAQVPAPALAPNFQSNQGYLLPAPNGIDAQYAWTKPGGKGREVNLGDVEGGWRLTHEDFPQAKNLGTMINDSGWINHGTAVIGVMASRDNGGGMTGIANEVASVTTSAIGVTSTADAVLAAGTALGRGGVVLIELHSSGPADSTPCTCNQGQCNFVPMEFFPAEFDAIRTVTANGVAVIEAAGNGSVNLDDPVYGGTFNRATHDSGAIMVAASLSTARTPACFTNAGTRIDVHGWGENVATLGYGDLFNGGVDATYTNFFNGTSSATPIVGGAAASLQGVALVRKGDYLTPAALRTLMTQTGTPQSGEFGTIIGPLPNLRAAIDSITPGTATTYTISGTVFQGTTPTNFDGIFGTGATCVVNAANYTCTVPADWSGTLTPQRSGFTFTPVSRSYVGVRANRTAQNYQIAAVGSQFTISGTVTANGVGLRNVVITPTTTNGTANCGPSQINGSYNCTVSSGWSGQLAAAAMDYAFSPASRSYTNVIANQVNQNFSTSHSATIYYKKGFPTPFIHYQPTGGVWTTPPGVAMTNDVDHCTYAVKTIDLGAATSFKVAFNNGSGTWDNNGGNNYNFNEGISTFVSGVISAGAPGNGPCSSTQSFTFNVTATTVWGENIYITGNTAVLGNWNTGSALLMSASSYPTWNVTVQLPAPQTIDYKYFRKNSSGTITWETGANRTVVTDGSGPVIKNDNNFRN